MNSPIIIIASQSLSIGHLTSEMAAKSSQERHPPHLIVGEPPPSPKKVVEDLKAELEIKWCSQANTDMSLLMKLKQPASERAKPNQPWYAKFQKRKRRGD
jgi:hypothetical protein